MQIEDIRNRNRHRLRKRIKRIASIEWIVFVSHALLFT